MSKNPSPQYGNKPYNPKMANPITRKQVNKRLKQIRKLKPNWDNHGADPINKQTCKQTRQLLAEKTMIPKHFLLIPTTDGGTQIEWVDKTGYFYELEIVPPHNF